MCYSVCVLACVLLYEDKMSARQEIDRVLAQIRANYAVSNIYLLSYPFSYETQAYCRATGAFQNTFTHIAASRVFVDSKVRLFSLPTPYTPPPPGATMRLPVRCVGRSQMPIVPP